VYRLFSIRLLRRDDSVCNPLTCLPQPGLPRRSSSRRHSCRIFARVVITPVKSSLFLQTASILLRAIVVQILLFPLVMVQAGEIRDPMQPPAFALKKFQQAKYKNTSRSIKTGVKVKKPAVKPMKLTSILYSPTRKIAIIDDQMLAVGGTIRGARVIKIDKRSARLVRKGKVINLRLPDDLIRIRKTLAGSES